MVTKGIEGDRSGPATDRRQNRRVAQVDAGVFDGRHGRTHGGSENRQAGFHVLELLRRRDASGRQSALARDLRFGAFERCPIALESGLALCKLRSQRPVIESEKEVPLLDFLPFLEIDLGDLSIHARLDHHRRDRLDAADRGDLDRCRHLDGDIRHDGLTRRRPRRSGVRCLVFVEDKPPKIIP
jgi:hypothetical protein